MRSVLDNQLCWLQVVQNNAARLITGLGRNSHITPILQQLHWLPLKFRVRYKVLSFIHQAVYNNHAPQYLKDMFTIYQPARNLCSASSPKMLVVKRTKRKAGTLSFPVMGAKLWNALPTDMRDVPSKTVFKNRLKTYLFREAYSA